MRTQFWIVLFFMAYSINAIASEEIVNFPPFGQVALYVPEQKPTSVILFISGDGGWKLGVVDMAREFTSLNAVVAGIGIHRYLKSSEVSASKCSYAAADFEALSKFIQKHLKMEEYIRPVLMGYSSGATLAYAVLVQAPPNTFAGAISMGFCPDLLLAKPLCKGNGLEWEPGKLKKEFDFLPSKTLAAPWVAFQGTIDQVCDADATKDFVQKVRTGEIVMLPKVGHGFGVHRRWLQQFEETLNRMKVHTDRVSKVEVSDLPLVEVPAGRQNQADAMAVILSGDGGWTGIDRQIGESLADSGIPTIGLNSLQYFWKPRTPETAAHDLSRVLQAYSTRWHKEKVILIGYSFGADVLPFLASRLPVEELQKINLIVLLGPSRTADFEFHITDWITGNQNSPFHVVPEIAKLKDKKILCVYGSEEENTICKNNLHFVSMMTNGGHHFGGDYEEIAQRILEEAS
jgi:type IV secretory pathway VirJ component